MSPSCCWSRYAVEQVEVGGLRIAYERAGSGRHWFCCTGSSATLGAPGVGSSMRSPTSSPWSRGRPRGPAAPPSVPETFGLTDYVDCLSDFVAALGLSRPHLAGLSFGGILALACYRRHPTLARSLVLASAYAGWAGSLPPAAVEQRLAFSLRIADLPVDELRAAMVPSMFSASASAEVIDDFLASMARHQPDGFRAMTRASAVDLRDVLPTITVPTLVLAGSEDVRAPVEVARALSSAIRRLGAGRA